MTNPDVVNGLSRSALFGGLPHSELEELALACGLRHLAKRQRLFSRGDQGTGMYVLVEGSLMLSVVSADGVEMALAVLRPPSTFGELALIDDGPRVATATAREQTVVVAVPAAPVLRLVATRPAFALALLRSLGVMVRRIDDAVSDLVLLDLPGRVCRFLLSHADATMPETTSDALVPVVVAITQTELAQLVGGSRQQVNRALRDLEDSGAIVRDGSRVTAVRPALLR